QRNETKIEDRRSRVEGRGSRVESSILRRSSILDPRSSTFFVSRRRSLRPERLHKNIETAPESPQNHTILPYLFVQVTQNGADKTKLWLWNRSDCARAIKIDTTYGTQINAWGSR